MKKFLMLGLVCSVVGAACAQGVLNSLPAGRGAGYHSPDSPIAPLPVRADVVPWSVLTNISTKTKKNQILPVFKAEQLAMHQKNQRIQGFMVPLDAAEKQSHFLLTSVPLTCSFCIPGGPESMIEVKAKTPVKYSLEPVVVERRFNVLPFLPSFLSSPLSSAVGVK